MGGQSGQPVLGADIVRRGVGVGCSGYKAVIARDAGKTRLALYTYVTSIDLIVWHALYIIKYSYKDLVKTCRAMRAPSIFIYTLFRVSVGM